MMEFFKTVMGRRFFESHVPQLVRHLGEISKELKRANDLKERETGEREVKATDKYERLSLDDRMEKWPPPPPDGPPPRTRTRPPTTEYVGRRCQVPPPPPPPRR